ncbi:hypothetical protein PanWU01x14_056780 [Parasponia andersonii]|uniref:Uncharacterized protein n=1 Tax=Parasponia andersonii TaxID=3476 RepID=A0A2P5DJP5_PARAD|nr:hypothetical protein PanWU01x14_056780 [Parasponia andersonii]
MNSLFSCFDGFCAETLTVKNVNNSSFTFSSSSSSYPSSSPAIINTVMGNQDKGKREITAVISSREDRIIAEIGSGV